MIKIDNLQLGPLEPVIRGMRNPMNSWAKSDSMIEDYMDCDRETRAWHKVGSGEQFVEDLNLDDSFVDGDMWNADASVKVGQNDLALMQRLAAGGPVHAKYRRMMTVFVDITAPLYWWKEFDTYKVGTVANSCSTMHKIQAKEFIRDDFSIEHLHNFEGQHWMVCMDNVIAALNVARERFLETGSKDYWWQMIQLLPSSYNQRRTVMLNYEVLHNIYISRKDHKLDEWREFCKWIETLPYSELITG